MFHDLPRPKAGILRLLAAVAAGFALLVPGAASAQEDQEEALPLTSDASAFAVAPGARDGEPDRGAFTLEVFPGQTVQDTFSIFNFTDHPVTFRVWPGDAYNTADGAFAIYGSEVEPADVGSWIELPATEVTVNPASRADIPVLIRVPANAEPGDHVGGIAALNLTPVQELDTGSADVDILRAVGSRVYVRVAGPLNPRLEVRNISVSATQPLFPYLTGRGRATVQYDIVNAGNLRLAPTTRVALAGPLGVARTRLDPVELRELLPGASITVRQTFDRVPPLGRMTATVELTAGDTSVTRSASFWAIPWLYVLFVAGFGGGFRWWWRHRNQEPPEEEAGGAEVGSGEQRDPELVPS